MEIKKFKQHFTTFLVAIRSKHVLNIDWHVPHKTYQNKSQFWRIIQLLGSSWPLEIYFYTRPDYFNNILGWRPFVTTEQNLPF